MSALTNNETLLAAFNQHIRAILDLATAISGGSDVTVNVPTPSVTVNVAAPNVTVVCNGTGGDSPPTDYIDDGETPPPGYPDYSSYNQSKCNGAQWFFNSWVQDFSYMQSLDAAALVAGGVALTLIIPGVNIAAIIAMVAVLVTGGLVASAMANGRYWIVNSESEIKCAIYKAQTATDAKAAVIALVASSELTLLERSLVVSFVTQEAMNRPFQLSNIPNLNADCTGCNASYVTVLPQDMCGTIAGTVTQQNGSQYTVQSAQCYWGCNPASPVQSIILKFDVACNVKVISGDSTFFNIGTYYSGANEASFASFFGVSADIQTNDGIGIHKSGTSQYSMVFEVTPI